MRGWGLVAVLALGCANRGTYVCTSSEQCVAAGKTGVCEPTGYCAFGDSACDGGFRYDSSAGGGLGGTCVPYVPPCGGVGEACCASEGEACVGNAFCAQGTCQVCATSVSFGRRFGCILRHDGSVWCTGENAQGQLGVGIPAMTPTALYSQVRDSAGQLMTDATSISAGREHACAVRGGNVWCWGRNDDGELGNGLPYPMPPMKLPPVPYATEVIGTDAKPLANIVAVVASYSFSCALDNAGGVWCWGANSRGQLGDGTTTPRSAAAPVLVSAAGAPLAGASELQSGGDQACVRKGDDIWCWGDNGDGELGNNMKGVQPLPIVVATTTSFAAGMWDSCFVNSDTSVSCMGWGSHGRLGNGSGAEWSGSDALVPSPVLATAGGTPLTGAKQVAAGAFGCALMTDSTMQCWGDDHYGQTGTGTSSTVPVPVVRADATLLTGIEAIYAHWTHVCARDHRGELWCWGRGLEGEFGDTFENRFHPSPLHTACP